MANKAGWEGINCLVEDTMTADWQWHMTLVLTLDSLDGKDVKSLRFVALVFLGRGGCKAATQAIAGILTV